MLGEKQESERYEGYAKGLSEMQQKLNEKNEEILQLWSLAKKAE